LTLHFDSCDSDKCLASLCASTVAQSLWAGIDQRAANEQYSNEDRCPVVILWSA
jgi:hypothetical protein